MTVSEPQWFHGPTESTSADERFVERLRMLALTWAPYGITAERSTAVPLTLPFLGVELPHLTTSQRWLWIKFLDLDEGLGFECSWGDDSYLDDWGRRDGDIPLTGPDRAATPEMLAERASEWVVTQASRVVVREDWYGLGRSTR